MKAILLSLAALILPLSVTASEPTSAAAHLGVSYAITHLTYVSCQAVANKEADGLCLAASATTALLAGAAKEALLDRSNSKKERAKDMGLNALGILTSALAIQLSF